MKTFILFTFITIINATASVYSQSESISLIMKDATVSDILNTIEQNSKYKFFYQNEQIDVSRTVSIDAVDAEINEVLAEVFYLAAQILEFGLLFPMRGAPEAPEGGRQQAEAQ